MLGLLEALWSSSLLLSRCDCGGTFCLHAGDCGDVIGTPLCGLLDDVVNASDDLLLK